MDVQAVVMVEVDQSLRKVDEGIFITLDFVGSNQVAQCCLTAAKERVCHPLTPKAGYSTL